MIIFDPSFAYIALRLSGSPVEMAGVMTVPGYLSYPASPAQGHMSSPMASAAFA